MLPALLLLPAIAAQTLSSEGTRTTRPIGSASVASFPSSSASAVCKKQIDFDFTNCGPVGHLAYLSPALAYAPAGAWRHTAHGSVRGAGSVSVQLSSSGVVWRVAGNATLLVDGAEAARGDSEVSVAGLPYGWHNYTLLTDGAVRGVTPDEEGSPFLPAVPGASTLLSTDNSTLFSSSGFTGPGVTTNGTARLTLTPPAGTALLELLGNYHTIPETMIPASPQPWGAFSVAFDPPPPFGPAVQRFNGSLYPSLEKGELVYADLAMHALLFRAELDPAVEYTVTVEAEGGEVAFSAVGVYPSQRGLAGGSSGVGMQMMTVTSSRTAGATGATDVSGGGTVGSPAAEPSSGAARVGAALGALAVGGAALLFM
jgi:hypothetical protein